MNTEEIKKNLAKNKIDVAIEELQVLLNHEFPRLASQLIAISRRYHEIREKVRSDVISHRDASREFSTITHSILDLIQIIEKSSKYYEGITNSIQSKNGIIEVLIDEKFKDFNNEKKEIIKGVIAAVLKIDSNAIKVKRVIEGSVKLYIELPEDKIEELIELFKNPHLDRKIGLLDDMNVKEIREVKFELLKILGLTQTLREEANDLERITNPGRSRISRRRLDKAGDEDY